MNMPRYSVLRGTAIWRRSTSVVEGGRSYVVAEGTLYASDPHRNACMDYELRAACRQISRWDLRQHGHRHFAGATDIDLLRTLYMQVTLTAMPAWTTSVEQLAGHYAMGSAATGTPPLCWCATDIDRPSQKKMELLKHGNSRMPSRGKN